MSLYREYEKWDRTSMFRYQCMYDLRKENDNMCFDLDVADYVEIKKDCRNKFSDLSLKMSQINVDNEVATDSVTIKVTVCPRQDGEDG